MWLFDFHNYYRVGRAVLAGLSPYGGPTGGFHNPYPVAMLFAPLALLPEPWAYTVYLTGSLLLLWKVVGRRSLWALAAFPVFYGLLVGQVDLPLMLIVIAGSPWTLLLAFLKPQLAFVLIPWLAWRAGWKGLAKSALVGGVLLGFSLILRPGWIPEWLAAQPPYWEYAHRTSNLYWLIPEYSQLLWVVSALILPVSASIPRRRESWALLYLLMPLANVYSASVLVEWIGPLEVALSWLAIAWVRSWVHAGTPMFVVGLSILLQPLLGIVKRTFLLVLAARHSQGTRIR